MSDFFYGKSGANRVQRDTTSEEVNNFLVLFPFHVQVELMIFKRGDRLYQRVMKSTNAGDLANCAFMRLREAVLAREMMEKQRKVAAKKK